jgi:phosphoribosyl 1,2-cyclic phosphodiesterase
MSLSLSILASGSAGNCSVLRTASGAVLIDCGIGPRTAASRMKSLDIAVDQIRAICLTHLDSDHFSQSWLRRIIQSQITVYCHQSRADELTGLTGAGAEVSPLIKTFNGHPFSPVESLQLTPISLDHDQHGSHGFLIESQSSRIGYATDLGRVSEDLIRKFCGVDVLAIESNYDPNMQLASDRPWFLKRRIMGGRGHLSNQQALEIVRKILDRSNQQRRVLPRHIVLLHRSRQCNCPNLLRELFCADPRIADRLVLAEQDRATDWLSVHERPGFSQLELQWT